MRKTKKSRKFITKFSALFLALITAANLTPANMTMAAEAEIEEEAVETFDVRAGVFTVTSQIEDTFDEAQIEEILQTLVKENETDENVVETTYAVPTTNCLRVRMRPTTESKALRMVHARDRVEVNSAEVAELSEEEAESWVPIKVNSLDGYVSSEYVELETEYEEVESTEEIEEIEEIEENQESETIENESEDEKVKDTEPQVKKAVETQTNPAVSASYDDVYLLGALIQCEAGGCPYEGMVAVGAVVMNRMRSGYADGTLRGVIYQPHQFTPAMNGALSATLSRGVRPECMEAAQQALNGVDNTGGCLNFRAAWTGHYGNNIGGNVFF